MAANLERRNVDKVDPGILITRGAATSVSSCQGGAVRTAALVCIPARKLKSRGFDGGLRESPSSDVPRDPAEDHLDMERGVDRTYHHIVFD